MSDENTLEITSPEVQPNPELDQLKQSIEALERKNHELIGKLKKAKTVPEGVNVQELLDFKNKAEQKEFESQGKYTEARQALEQQFREATAEKDKRIAELEARVRELELITPAVSALADVVHDPDLILKTKLSSDQIATSARLSASGPSLCRHGCRSSPSLRAAAHRLAVPLVIFQPESITRSRPTISTSPSNRGYIGPTAIYTIG